ncbi:MAG: hypothetical protein E7620_05345 [Ruminococcaceae bacterium]|nr:hypothetical protein [Oscillospiraceae bacterium]
MKKILLLLCTTLLLSAVLFGCGEKHSFRAEWSTNEKYHWHACADEGCAEQTDRGEHQWNAGEVTEAATPDREGTRVRACVVCGMMKTEKFAYVPPKTTIGAEEWRAAFSPVNATLTIGDMTCRITENQWCMITEGRGEKRFLVKQEKGWREVRYTPERGYEAAGSQNVEGSYVGFIYSPFNLSERYAEFSYDKNTQSYVNAAGDRVWFEDGKLMRLQVNGVMGELHSHGSTQPEVLPENVLDRK